MGKSATAILLDHLVVAARNLEEGAAWVESRLGVSMSPGGRHELMGLDAPRMQARLARSPALIHWAVRTDDIDRAIAATAGGRPEVLALERSGLRARIRTPRGIAKLGP